MGNIWFWVIIALVLIGIILWFFRPPKKDTIMRVNGPVGIGKSSFSVWYAYKELKKKRFRRKVINFFRKLSLRPQIEEEPQLYSNVPLFNKEGFVPVGNELINRKGFRFAYDSVCYLNEASIMANSMSYKDQDLSDRLTLFVKLIRHEMKGKGVCLILDTQSVDDLHYSADRSISYSTYLEKAFNLPFVRPIKYSQIKYINSETHSEDLEEEKKYYWTIVPKKVFKMYDSYCYSTLTDDLPPKQDVHKIKRDKYRFFIPTYTHYKEVEINNMKMKGEYVKKYEKE